ncbi:MAG: hypothetical protein IJS38_04025 [Erysipelotrichaceae bacterium]|nr:hypothetical protein [Erysipelotrichaceae bacterium]
MKKILIIFLSALLLCFNTETYAFAKSEANRYGNRNSYSNCLAANKDMFVIHYNRSLESINIVNFDIDCKSQKLNVQIDIEGTVFNGSLESDSIEDFSRGTYPFDGYLHSETKTYRVSADLVLAANDEKLLTLTVYDEKENYDILVFGEYTDSVKSEIDAFREKLFTFEDSKDGYDLPSRDSSTVFKGQINVWMGTQIVGHLYLFHANQMTSTNTVLMKANTTQANARTYITNNLGNSYEIIDVTADQLTVLGRSNNGDVVLITNAYTPQSSQTNATFSVPYLTPTGQLAFFSTTFVTSSITTTLSKYDGATINNSVKWVIYNGNGWYNGKLDGDEHSTKGYPFEMTFHYQGSATTNQTRFFYFTMKLRYYYSYEYCGVVNNAHFTTSTYSKQTSYTYIP